ncbi:MAG: 30S ribosomal protein S3 [Candidatus Dadabacteria bacterium]|nr:MAG: 30S ribosomal protein S3 [Candidatus Dadabacteria bacterium]
MGQKVPPLPSRIGITENWRSRWYAASKDFSKYIAEDIKVREFVKQQLKNAGVSKIEIERAASKVKINIFSAKPGLVIGKKGKEIEELRRKLKNVVKRDIALNIIEVRKPDLDAQLVAETVAFQLERRVSYRRAMKEGVSRVLRAGAEGVKLAVSGRLAGAEIARTEWYREGRVPLHTLRADIDYGFAEARTTYGIIGVKVWIFRGEVFGPGEEKPIEALQI